MFSLNTVISIICLLSCIIFFFYFRWYIKRRLSVSDFFKECRSEADKTILEIDAATERNISLVENYINQLKEITQDAESRVKIYSQELDRSRKGETLYTSLGRGIHNALSAIKTADNAPISDIKTPLISALAEEDGTVNSGMHTQTPLQPQKPAAPPVPPASKMQLRMEIDRLAEEGFSPSEIASRLKISTAEARLAMDLLKRRKK